MAVEVGDAVGVGVGVSVGRTLAVTIGVGKGRIGGRLKFSHSDSDIAAGNGAPAVAATARPEGLAPS